MIKVFSSLIGLFLAASAVHAQSPIDMAQKANRSLVQVKTVFLKTMRDGRTASYERNGVGIVLDARGLIVTNTHTIINAPHIYVILPNGTKLEAEVAMVHPVYDFSFLKVTPAKPLKPIVFADSALAELGQEIIAIGHGDYNSQSILSGQITGLMQSRSMGDIEFLQLNLNLYKGDSGGPILDRQGRLLGIVMANAKNEDRLTLAIASDKIHQQYLLYRQNLP